MDTPEEPRDLLAARIRRLEARIEELAGQVTTTGEELGRATAHLDALVDLVGRLGRVVDVQGTAIHGEEAQLERKVGTIEERVGALTNRLAEVVGSLERIGEQLAKVLAGRDGPAR